MKSTARALILSRPTVVAALITAFALVVGATALSAFSTHEISAADRRAGHAQQTLVVVNQLLTTITEAENAQRGYLLTRDDKYLSPYEVAVPRYHAELALLERQFEGEPERVALLHHVASLCDQRFAEIERTIRLRRDHGIAPALNVLESDEGWRISNEIRQLVHLLQTQELAQLSSHTATAAVQARVFQTLNGALLVLATIMAGAVTILVVRRLHELEGLIKVCAWTQRVQWRGRWITFEEYLAERFNLHCTHGISDEAARQLGKQIADTPVPPEVGDQKPIGT